MMNVKDKDNGKSREGSGRVGIWKATKSPLCYTLECNYYTGVQFNDVAKWSDETFDSEYRMKKGSKFCSNQDEFYKKSNPFFDKYVFMDVGAGVAIALLDMINKNEINRIQNSNMKNLNNV